MVLLKECHFYFSHTDLDAVVYDAPLLHYWVTQQVNKFAVAADTSTFVGFSNVALGWSSILPPKLWDCLSIWK